MNVSCTRLSQVSTICIVFLSLGVSSWAAEANATGKAIASVTVEPLETGENFILTFAHPFKKGDIPDMLIVMAGDK